MVNLNFASLLHLLGVKTRREKLMIEVLNLTYQYRGGLRHPKGPAQPQLSVTYIKAITKIFQKSLSTPEGTLGLEETQGTP